MGSNDEIIGEGFGLAAPWRMKALALAGRIILENGGEIYRTEDTVLRMASVLGLRETDAFCIPSGLFISFTDENGERQTSVNRMISKGIHLSRVDAVNEISRRLSAGELKPEELLSELNRAAVLDGATSFWRVPILSFFVAFGFALMFDGGMVDMLVSGLCAGLTPLCSRLLTQFRDDTVVKLLLGSFLCTALPLLFHQATGLGLPEAMIAGALMPLVPGLSMTGAVQDVVRGDMISGMTHAARAVLAAALIAGGALMATRVIGLLGGVL